MHHRLSVRHRPGGRMYCASVVGASCRRLSDNPDQYLGISRYLYRGSPVIPAAHGCRGPADQVLQRCDKCPRLATRAGVSTGCLSAARDRAAFPEAGDVFERRGGGAAHRFFSEVSAVVHVLPGSGLGQSRFLLRPRVVGDVGGCRHLWRCTGRHRHPCRSASVESRACVERFYRAAGCTHWFL